MPLTVVETDAFPSSLQVPAAGEPASAPSLLSQFLQGISNRTRWLYNRVSVFVTGGTLVSSGNVTLATGSSKEYQINSVEFGSYLDNGRVTVSGSGGLIVTGPANVGDSMFVGGQATVGGDMLCGGIGQFSYGFRGSLRAAAGDPSAGTHLITPSLNPFVYNASSSAVASGCVWQIASYTPLNGEPLRLINLNSANPITVKDPGGGTIISLSFTASAVYAVTLAYLAGSWTIVDLSYHS